MCIPLHFQLINFLVLLPPPYFLCHWKVATLFTYLYMREIVYRLGLRTPDGIAFDWVSGKIYWTDAQENTISRVSILNNSSREIILTEDLDEPRAIAVSPCDG